jgi:hypothetical protein
LTMHTILASAAVGAKNLQILLGRCTICPRTRVDAINRSAALALYKLMGLGVVG